MNERYQTATIKSVNLKGGYSFGRTEGGEDVLIHLASRAEPHLEVFRSSENPQMLSFRYKAVPVFSEAPPGKGVIVRFRPKKGRKGLSSLHWMGRGLWRRSEAYQTIIAAYEVTYIDGVETEVELHFWGKLGDLIEKFPLDNPLDPLKGWQDGNSRTEPEFKVYQNGGMQHCEDPRPFVS